MILIVYLTVPLVVYLLIKRKIVFLLELFVIPAIIYFASYTPLFLGHHSPPGQSLSNLQTFIGLQQQMYWYHTRLEATHPYQSRPEQWIFDLRPVWIFVDYQDNKVANIYALENPLVAWAGLLSVFILIFELVRKYSFQKLFVIVAYLGFFILWFRSPRIMFNYHYLASTVFLTIAIGFMLNKISELKNGKFLLIACLLSLTALFIYFYPLWTGIHIDKNFADSHFWFKSWK